MNFLVSPYYPESGGTVIDWWSNELAEELGFDEEDFDDDDFELPEIDDDDIPF